MVSPSIMKPPVIVICGPTGVGKTAAAIEVAKALNGQIISADSMQIYRHMDIGTAKPTEHEQACVPHHLIDIVDPDESFDASRYAEMAGEVIIKLHAQAVFPIVAGGTGLYIKALLYGLFRSRQHNSSVRMRLKEEAARLGTRFLHERLLMYDPDTAEKIHPNDCYRIIRALEVYEITGKSISTYHNEHRFADAPFRTLKIAMNMEREELYARINSRVDTMIEAGFVQEVERLLGRGYTADLKSMQSIGYRHMVDYIEGRSPWEETLRTMKRDTRRYAKRQMTWFKADSGAVWVESGQTGEIQRLVETFLN